LKKIRNIVEIGWRLESGTVRMASGPGTLQGFGSAELNPI
jgi:hypothetical protein